MRERTGRSGHPVARRPPWPALIGVGLAVVVAVALGAILIGHGPGPRSAPAAQPRPTPLASEPSVGASRSGHGSPATGPVQAVSAVAQARTRITRVQIPAPSSGFPARDAYVMAPSLAPPPGGFPVLVLLAGTPGASTNWLQLGNAAAAESNLAARNRGPAPIVIMPEINATYHGDSECVDSPRGKVETYLTADVRRYAIGHLHASRNPAQWAVAGVSEGGTCSVMLALRHPSLYRTFVDFSGPETPSVSETTDRARTTATLFSGSTSAYNQHDPVWLLAHNRYPQLAGWFECGTGNSADLHAQATLVRLAGAAGITTVARTTPGGHGWSTWRTALTDAMPWIWSRIGAAG